MLYIPKMKEMACYIGSLAIGVALCSGFIIVADAAWNLIISKIL